MAEQRQTATKYLLDELSEEERLEFEAHLFECSVCADQVRQDFTAAENLKQVVQEQKAGGGTLVLVESLAAAGEPLAYVCCSSLGAGGLLSISPEPCIRTTDST